MNAAIEEVRPPACDADKARRDEAAALLAALQEKDPSITRILVQGLGNGRFYPTFAVERAGVAPSHRFAAIGHESATGALVTFKESTSPRPVTSWVHGAHKNLKGGL